VGRLNCYDKFFALLELLAIKHQSLITTRDIQEFMENKLERKYTMKSAQNDMKQLKLVASDYPNLFKVEENKIKVINPNFIIRNIMAHHEHGYVLGLIRNMLEYSAIDEKMFDAIMKYYNKYQMYETIGFNPATPRDLDIDKAESNEIARAIENRKKIHFQYNRYNEQKEYKYFEPYKIVIVEDGWYLFGKLSDSDELRTFLVNYIQNVETTNTSFDVNFDAVNRIYNAKTIWALTQKDIVYVEAELSNRIAHKILELKGKFDYFANQEILEEKEDGTIIIGFEVADDNDVQVDFKYQVYRWLPDIKILSPDKYVDFIKEDLGNI
jgi:predicted DNA-binding transcriptional regulator YafY